MGNQSQQTPDRQRDRKYPLLYPLPVLYYMYSSFAGNYTDNYYSFTSECCIREEAAPKKEVQENLKHEKEFLSFALESGNIFTFRY